MNALNRYRTLEGPSKLYETNTRPILVRVSNALNSYVVKHNNGLKPCNKLANELLAFYWSQSLVKTMHFSARLLVATHFPIFVLWEKSSEGPDTRYRG